jgi:cytochrome b pre-mRNA-processing protein 3
MFSRMFGRDRRGNGIAPFLYGVIVAQARTPFLYAGLGVPDSVEGRFEMVVLHLVLLTRRLKIGGEAGREAGQGAFDLFCRDMDNSLREMGVGDLKVPRRMREVGEAYFGRAAAYEPGLASASADLLTEAVARTVFAGDSSAGGARMLAAYSIAAAESLISQDDRTILEEGPAFPEPATFFVEAGGR